LRETTRKTLGVVGMAESGHGGGRRARWDEDIGCPFIVGAGADAEIELATVDELFANAEFY